MRRRDFIAGLGSAVAWPLAARAQQPAMPLVGYVSPLTHDADSWLLAGFRRGLSNKGYVEDRNLAIEYRYANNVNERLPALVDDLIRRRVAVIAANATSSVLAAKAATRTIPIVFMTGGDPVELGLVGSMPRPGGNLTGVTLFNVELAAKVAEFMHALVPTANVVASLVNPTSPVSAAVTREREIAAGALGLRMVTVGAIRPSDIEGAVASAVDQGARALLVSGDAMFIVARDRLFAYVDRYMLPAIYTYREFAEAGGLMSYGTSIADVFTVVGEYTGRILKGEKPADLPVQQPTKIELTINMKTAKALGLIIPQALLATADKVIE
jgi:putative tryptophan/tyrosine transport system substrate-binding protein